MKCRSVRVRLAVVFAVAASVAGLGVQATPAAADSYQRISGEGSSWAANFIDAVRVNVRQFGMTVDYNPSGSTAGRKNYLNGTDDFAVSDIPFQFHPEDGSAPENPAPDSYAYMPITAGGTSFMYNLLINGKRVTNLRLSGENVTKIFTGVITMWNDPAIKADNPGLTLPAKKVVPVVRSDGSGSTAQFTKWMIAKHGALWTTYCQKSGRAPACGFTSFYPTISGMIAQSGDLGVAGYVSQSFAEGAIGYVNYSYALNSQFPVAKLLNAAGYYTEPTPQNVAVALLNAKINTNKADPALYLTQDLSGVYNGTDPRNYELSSYSYLILPTKVAGQFNLAKGKTLGAFGYYAMCQAQQQAASLGYSPMPINLVQASFDQIKKIPGVVVESIDITKCKNPTFSADGTNQLAKTAPQPQACDKKGVVLCPTGTGGLANVPTAVIGGTTGGSGGSSNGGSSGGGSTCNADTGQCSTGGGSAGGSTGNTTPSAGSTTGNTTPSAGSTTGDTTPSAGSTGGGSTDNGSSGNQNSGGQTGGLAVGAVTPTVIAQTSTSASVGMLVLIALFLVALVVGPAIAWQAFSKKKTS